MSSIQQPGQSLVVESQLVDAPDIENDAEKGFSKSILVSAVRCTLTYVILPFVTPLIGLASDIGPVLGITLGLVAIAANFLSIRRFWVAEHKWRKHVTVLHVGVLILLFILLVNDVRDLLA